MKNPWNSGWALVLALLLGGCATVPDTAVQATGGRAVEYAVAGQGAPVVVFENGLGGTLEWWAKVWPEVARDTTVLAYNRAGYGKSEASPEARDGAHIVEELRALLRERGLAPPYILVGHSLGGLYMQWFARRYPQELAALVLVDSAHPHQLKGAGDPQSWPWLLKWTFGVLSSETAKRELAAVDATGESVLGLAADPAVPVFVLSALRPMGVSSALADDANRKRADIANLYPHARQVWVDSDHGIPLEKPEAVVAAIREAMGVARRSP
ncbi:alpha/beta fold hydrolase [Paenacidovorax monticola]|uniref:Alpha/beta fold hydrolase n=1 Tax=Paenacidovorax monticola TaxID=1926868 RepID=A0A7H0HGJ7_9BURK|nr:alpha/beta fold hydrolase [Paenacidovorax monticola]QNP59663.1 alpha/beta fold hydrolase [Paenacidovorax monticola]